MVMDGSGTPIDPNVIGAGEVSQSVEGMDENYVKQCVENMGAEREQKLAEYFGSVEEAIKALFLFIHPILVNEVDSVLQMFEAAKVTKIADYEAPVNEDLVRAITGKALSDDLNKNPHIILRKLSRIYQTKDPWGSRSIHQNPGSSKTSGAGTFLQNDALYRGTQK